MERNVPQFRLTWGGEQDTPSARVLPGYTDVIGQVGRGIGDLFRN